MKAVDIALKDLTRSARSLFLLGMTLGAPLVITGLMYFAFGGLAAGDASPPPIRVGVVNADHLPVDAPFETALGDSLRGMFFDESVSDWIAASDLADAEAARAAVDGRAIDVAVVIPPAFTEAHLAGATGRPIVILHDPTLTIAPAVARDMVTAMLDGVAGGGIAYRVISERHAALGRSLDPAGLPALLERYTEWYAGFQRALFHEPGRAALALTSAAVSGEPGHPLQAMLGLMMAGQLIFFSFFTGAYAMLSILQEDEEGTLARLFTTPTDRTLILAGKFLAVFLTVLLQGLVLMAVGRFAFGVNWGQPASAALGLLGQMIAAVGLAVLLIAFVKSSKQGGPVLGGVLTALGMLSGLFTANIEMPAAFNYIGNFTPQGWVLKAWRLALAGEPPAAMLVPVGVMVAMGIVMFFIGAGLFRRRYA